MYDRFEPLGGAFGLPPYRAGVRREWIVAALANGLNVAAFSSAGELVGHCFLVAGNRDVAELAVFVHQGRRLRGIGTALVKAALELGGTAGLQRVEAVTDRDNRAALHLLERCGFRVTDSTSPEIELEIDLAAACAIREEAQVTCEV
jgi:RimJ/RimL family protein N-acetyltransferase